MHQYTKTDILKLFFKTRGVRQFRYSQSKSCHNPFPSGSSNIDRIRTITLKNCNIFKSINKTSLNQRFSQISHPIHQPKSSISVEFHGLICRKIKNACFPTPGTTPETRTFIVNFFNGKMFLKQTVSSHSDLLAKYGARLHLWKSKQKLPKSP